MTAPAGPRDALEKSVTVPVPPDRAFALFTSGVSDWWPLVTHSVYELESAGVAIAPHVGGDIVETSTSGASCVWGTVRVWEPGMEVAFSWHPGQEPDAGTDVSVRFEPAPGGTRVVLVHTGWDRRADAERARASYDTGWRLVLDRYAGAVAA
jgi:uncharacterized protein YndB with AHSA1/START domain